MEILSKGEKIKRARIYKGFTLKQVCGNRISVSKLSCIENDKVEPEEALLKYIAEILELDLEYLKQDVKEQLENNLEFFKKNKKLKDYDEKIQYSLKTSKSRSYYDIAFSLMHLLFNYYIDNKKNDDIHTITSEYYDLCQKSYNEKNREIYYMDMARFSFCNKEFEQALNYYNNVRNSLIAKEDIKSENLITCTYNETVCYTMLKNYEKVYEIAQELAKVVEYEQDEKRKCEMYHMLALVALRMDSEKFDKYEKKAYELFKDDNERKAIAIYNYAAVMFDINLKEQATKYMKKSLGCFPKDNRIKLVDFMLSVVEELLENNVVDLGKEVCDEVLNYAIEVDEMEFIDRAYYYKSKLLIKTEEYLQAELYMNLCLDALMKFGNNREIYDRYLEMGNMYYNMNNTNDALKYFNLAVNMEKKL